MMANLAKLKIELTDDPLERGYSEMTDAEAAADLNTAYRTRNKIISSQALVAWAGAGANDSTGVRSRFERIEANREEAEQSSRVVRGACKAAVAMLGLDEAYLDMSRDDHAAMVDALVAGSVLTADEKAELISISTESITRAQELGIRKPLEGHVFKARA